MHGSTLVNLAVIHWLNDVVEVRYKIYRLLFNLVDSMDFLMGFVWRVRSYCLQFFDDTLPKIETMMH